MGMKQIFSCAPGVWKRIVALLKVQAWFASLQVNEIWNKGLLLFLMIYFVVRSLVPNADKKKEDDEENKKKMKFEEQQYYEKLAQL